MSETTPGDELASAEARRRTERWAGRNGVLEIGEHVMPCVVMDEPTWEMAQLWQVVVRVEGASILEPIRYVEAVRLSVRFDDTTEKVFAGVVASVDWSGSTALVSLVHPMIEFQEVRIGGAGYWTSQPKVVTPLIGSLVGMSAGLDQSGLSGKDLVYVICPIDGIEVDDTFVVGQVIFTPDRRLTYLVDYAELDPRLVEQFTDVSCWAIVILDGMPVDWPTTARGFHLIDTALAWIMAAHSTGLSAIRDQTHAWFDRRWVRSRPTRRPVRLVCGDYSGNRVLSGETSSDEGPPLGDPEVHGLPQLPWDLTREQLLYALLAWRRAMETADRFIACSALCEAIECVVAGTKVDPDFTDAELDRLRDAIPGMSPEQKQRVMTLVANLNDGTFMMKLRAFAEERGIELDPADEKAFQAVRGARNRFVHGRQRGDLDWQPLHRARAWVARFLVEAVITTPPSEGDVLGLLRGRER